ncbi:MAG: nitroreductase [Lachnospiraceae bacterium]|nr:nitroreductase [Lachnospiraceae bacterium]
MTNETLECLETRRSIRKYQSKQVDEEALQAILKAGTYAPTGAGRQAPVIVVVQDQELLKKISKMNAAVAGVPEGMDPFYGAPTVAFVLADKTAAPSWMEDGALVAGNILNAAHSVGVDSCYIYRAKEVFSSDEGLAIIKEWGLDENYIGVANCILGYRDCDYPDAAPRKDNYVIRV